MADLPIQVFYVSNDNLLEVQDLRNDIAAEGEYLNSAAVSVTLLDADGAEVAGQAWPLTMNYVAASNGKYRATMSDDLVLVNSKRYTARTIADAGAGLKAQWDLPVRAITRTE